MKNKLVIHDAKFKHWLCFQNPDEIIKADSIDQVVPKLQLVNDLIAKHQMYAAGFISYEASTAFDSVLETHSPGSFPLLWFGLYKKPEIIELPKPTLPTEYQLNWKPSVIEAEYHQSISKIKEYIALGETYQVNYTLRLNSPFSGDSWELFLKLVQAQNADYGAYVDIDNFAICSASPELFFDLDGNNLTSRPMKGTAARGLTLATDHDIANQLHFSEKNRAENVMIVDMIRNDMGRIANINTVKVPSLFNVEKYPTVWQMTSTVTAKTTASINDIMGALFPCASITGAPKARTMQIIQKLENTPRRIYTGCIGFINPQRQAQFNVAIRTVLIDKKNSQAEYGVGGGIVWDSVSSDEYQECQIKAQVLTLNQPDFSLLETILWQPDDGYFVLDYHLQRLQGSAIYFNFNIDINRLKKQLDELTKKFLNQAYKVRLLLDYYGKITYQTIPLSPVNNQEFVKLGMCCTPIDSNNLFLYHKTTNRQVYETAKAAFPDCDDVLLWNERGEITETCIGNIVVELNGKFITPPVKCGLLAGTFRADLLEKAKIQEEIITVKMLKYINRIYIINSVQKWREAVLISH
ncbi:aminodeoxychorismate synthase component I [Dolichospermum sp. UHCC 0259]|uniref:aminodeoxychorismate synthase component I n=1 Tax=Dolichospermum sp. UHCC 0259 TaxID=2590010 RepID=UPI001445F0E5|nr:aminodeoxychorismate synthase component I [Dolichospermum sp. UHCC 0259]MTJ50533.1 aminodeoxychorismate synthase component I [Dolichospermum sp. UHCC 0259]